MPIYTANETHTHTSCSYIYPCVSPNHSASENTYNTANRERLDLSDIHTCVSPNPPGSGNTFNTANTEHLDFSDILILVTF